MTAIHSESDIVEAVAKQATQRIARKIAAEFQRMRIKHSGDDSPLKTTWDEICVQIQHDRSILWDVFDETVRAVAGGHIDTLLEYERAAIWLQTDSGMDWSFQEADERGEMAVVDDDVIDYILDKGVYALADEWSNRRIRAYIEWADGG